MKLGVLTVPYGAKTLEETLKFLKGHGVQMVELGGGGYPGDSHLKLDRVINDAAYANGIKGLLKKYDMGISAISVHGNPVHPDKSVADKAHGEFVSACEAAEILGADTVVTFSGCPGGGAGDKTPNWVTAAWPNDYAEILEWQWSEVLIPYWKKAAEIAKSRGVKVALEMHPGFCVYNTSTMLKLRAATSDAIGANFDPSHLFWQGIKPVAALRELGNAVHYFHAKDSYVDPINAAKNGVLDLTGYTDILNRSWSFRTVGYGHDAAEWRDIISTLRLIGYNKTISIEHEDALMSIDEGLVKAIEFLKGIVIFEDAAEAWWV